MELRKHTLSFLLLTVLLLSVNMVIAEQSTQQYNKMFLDPLYREGVDRNEQVTYTLSVDTPDGIGRVENAMINFQVWHNPSVRYYLWVNGETCNTESFYVSTSYANAGEGNIFFDCSNVITGEGNYTIVFQPDDDIGTITGWIDLTYMNDPDGDVDVFGTEYVEGENGTIFLQLKDNQGNTVDNASCNLDVYYPDKTKWHDGVSMTFLEKGLFYYDVVIPDYLGVYMMGAFCYYETQEQLYQATSIEYDGILKDGSTCSTAEVETADGIFCHTDEGFYQQFNFMNNGIGNINLTNVAEIKVDWLGQNEKDGTYLQIYNFNTASWDDMGASFVKSKNADRDQKNSHGVSRSVTTSLEDYRSSNEVRIRIFYGLDDKKFLTDRIDLHFHTIGQAVNDIRGSGEIHVSPKVWTDTYTPLENRTVAINVSEVSGATAEEVWNYNGTISSNLLSQFATEVWNYTSRTLTDFNFIVDVNYGLISDYVWNATTRTLTAFGFQVDIDYSLAGEYVWNNTQRNLTFTSDETNYSLINEGVWNNPQRNLTYYAPTTDETNYSLINEGVWNYTTRELTNAPFDPQVIANATWNYNNRTLTSFDFLVGLNATALFDIWNYSDRQLTDFNFSVMAEINETAIAEEVWSENQSKYTYGIIIE